MGALNTELYTILVVVWATNRVGSVHEANIPWW